MTTIPASPLPTTSVVLVDDDPLVRTALHHILEGDPTIRVIGEGDDGQSGADAVQRLRPDVVLLDLRMPRFDGIWAINRLRSKKSDVHIVVLTAFDADNHVVEALRAGACGFLLKDSSPSVLIEAVHAARQEEPRFSPSILTKLVRLAVSSSTPRYPLPDSLSPREHNIAELVAQGLSNKEIGEELLIGSATVKTHLRSLMDKLGVANRVQIATAVIEARKQ